MTVCFIFVNRFGRTLVECARKQQAAQAQAVTLLSPFKLYQQTLNEILIIFFKQSYTQPSMRYSVSLDALLRGA